MPLALQLNTTTTVEAGKMGDFYVRITQSLTAKLISIHSLTNTRAILHAYTIHVEKNVEL